MSGGERNSLGPVTITGISCKENVTCPPETGYVAVFLSSWWALVPASLIAMLMVIRTALEDRTLRAELPGYAEYAQRTRYRLLPGVW